jgi:hypothetical protein
MIFQRMVDKTPFGAVSMSFSGYNLYYNAFNTQELTFDPNVGIGSWKW